MQQMLVQITISILYGAYLALPVVFGGLVFLYDIHRLQLCVSCCSGSWGPVSFLALRSLAGSGFGWTQLLPGR